MKKTILAISLATLSTGVLACQPYCGDTNVSSTASGKTSSGSYASSNNMTGFDAAAHGSFAKSTNTTEVSGKGGIAGLPFNGSIGAGATSATTTGSTLVGAGGIGQGGANAVAYQSGVGSINVYDSYCKGRDVLDLNSGVNTWGQSSVNVNNTGLAGAGTLSHATNVTVGAGSVLPFGLKSVATGETAGLSGSTTWSLATPGDAALAEAFAGQEGSYFVKFGSKKAPQ